MGRNNKQRRRAKAAVKAKAQARTQTGRAQERGPAGPGESTDSRAGDGAGDWFGASGMPRAHPGGPSASAAQAAPSAGQAAQDDAELTLSWLRRWLRLRAEGRPLDAADAEAEVLMALESPARGAALCRHLASRLEREVGWLWEHGWEPADVLRSAGREVTPGAVALVRDVVADSLSRYAAATVSPRWHDQLSVADATVWWSGTPDPLTARTAGPAGVSALTQVLIDALSALDLLAELPALQPIEAPPGQWRAPSRLARAATGRVDEKVLERVRAMLAKAESTPYEAEAETFTAAAQSLMSRHSIDQAMLAASAPRVGAETPCARRVGVDRPYDAPKAALLDAVATANRCRSVWSKHLGFCTILGFESDVAATQTLFTSLLLQATHAMTGHGSKTTREGLSRTRSFRQSFLLAYASRIGHRLREAADHEVEQACERAGGRPTPGRAEGVGTDLVAVLQGRTQEVDAAVELMFPELVTRRSRSVQNVEGWTAGTYAADTASLFPAAAVEGG